jgi:hypothetical protein
MIRNDVLFRSQYWDLENWKDLGFSSREDAEYWENSSCGILCLGMALESKQSIPNSVLIKKGKELDAYTHKKGWSHSGLVRIAKEYGATAYRKERISLRALQKHLDDGELIIASIKWAFKPNLTFAERVFPWVKRGGHLALIIGYDDNGFYVHHTSIRPEYNWEGRLIPYSEFQQGFTGRGIVLKS